MKSYKKPIVLFILGKFKRQNKKPRNKSRFFIFN